MKLIRSLFFYIGIGTTVLFLVVNPTLSQEIITENDEIVFRHCLAIDRVSSSGRSALHTDAIEAQIVTGQFSPPIAGFRFGNA
ncbi:MAG: hypothetical protein C4527_06480 [Candidatus Omnitrophota bacterium]|jgi:hypothetical protein|nr:MAG: hypothetical protein C4527_06480 [Candidatus Omnitrophota bacterium]